MNAADRQLALTADCGLSLCGALRGEQCINTFDRTPREEPHSNRLARAQTSVAREES